MTGGTLTLSYTLNDRVTSIEVGSVTTIQESFQKSCTVVPLVSMDVADTFAIDTKTAKVINIQYQRKQDRNGMDNATWIGNMLAALNRWQCRSDGFTLTYEADPDNPYIAEINENGYVKSFSYTLTQGEPDYIKGSIEFHVGTMYVNGDSSSNERVYASDYTLYMTDVDGVFPYTLMSADINCVESYTIYGGPEIPFEYMTLTIPRNRLTSVAPVLTGEDGIIAGCNRITLNAIGRANMTVTKCKMSDNYYTITAYCDADALRGFTLPMTIKDTPEEVIRFILGNVDGQYPVRYTESDGTLIMHYTSTDVGFVTFEMGTNVWRVLQICAMLMGCRIFFANNCAYVVDYRLAGGSAIQDAGEIDLFDIESTEAATVGTPSLGDEGIDTVINSLTIQASITSTDDDGNTESETEEIYVSRTESILLYNERSTSMNVRELVESSDATSGEQAYAPNRQATVFGENYLDYREEPQQSIEFTMKEMYRGDSELGPYWCPWYIPAARASKIIDEEDDVEITNTSKLTGDAKPQKLFLSSYERSYPEGTSTYVFGAVSTIDLASSTSQIYSALGK